MADIMALQAFVEPYYANKDIMHNMWHIELVEEQDAGCGGVESMKGDNDYENQQKENSI